MTEPTTDPIETTDLVENTSTEAIEDSDTEAEDTTKAGNKEAARYRRQLREVEAERDVMSERLHTYERAEVESRAGEALADASDIWSRGLTLDDLRAEDGLLDPELIDQAVSELLSTKPHYGRHAQRIPGRPRQRLRGGHDPDGEPRTGATWSEVLDRPGRRG